MINADFVYNPSDPRRFRPLSWGLSFNRRLSSWGNASIPHSFRPLSWGLSFNVSAKIASLYDLLVFVPFLGDFLSRRRTRINSRKHTASFSSPFLGTFFQLPNGIGGYGNAPCFRPLSWGLSFNKVGGIFRRHGRHGFRPLSWGLSFNRDAAFNYGYGW